MYSLSSSSSSSKSSRKGFNSASSLCEICTHPLKCSDTRHHPQASSGVTHPCHPIHPVQQFQTCSYYQVTDETVEQYKSQNSQSNSNSNPHLNQQCDSSGRGPNQSPDVSGCRLHCSHSGKYQSWPTHDSSRGFTPKMVQNNQNSHQHSHNTRQQQRRQHSESYSQDSHLLNSHNSSNITNDSIDHNTPYCKSTILNGSRMSTSDMSVSSDPLADSCETETHPLRPNTPRSTGIFLLSTSVEEWSVEDVGFWLESNNFGVYRSLFCDTHRIDGQVLITLKEDDLQKQLNITVYGDIKRLCLAFDTLRKFYKRKLVIKMKTNKNSGSNFKENISQNSNDSGNSKGSTSNSHASSSSSDISSEESVEPTELDDSEDEHAYLRRRRDLTKYDQRYSKHYSTQSHRNRDFKPELWKALIALLYAFMTTWVTAFVMVIVHDRVPDMDTYPPLPDIILDNLPLIPWAFGMCEFCGIILLSTWCLILIFHKHRFILIRRMFSLFGSVFLLRCVTMLITSLSVPGRHLNCKARAYGDWTERLYQAYLIWQGGGMSLQGVRTCGDYMYSGHTVVLTMLNFFITEYTPPKFYLIHTVSWVLNLFGIFFILAAHEHYSIDVFVAFYISTRIFLYYHTLANNRALYQRDRRRTRIWFPLFSFFEANVPGIVPNEFENPFKNIKNVTVQYLETYPPTSRWFGNNELPPSRTSSSSSSNPSTVSANSNEQSHIKKTQ